jgi:hypothetical protein
VELVVADGSLLRLTRERTCTLYPGSGPRNRGVTQLVPAGAEEDPQFGGAVTSCGCLGVVTQLTVQLVDDYDVKELKYILQRTFLSNGSSFPWKEVAAMHSSHQNDTDDNHLQCCSSDDNMIYGIPSDLVITVIDSVRRVCRSIMIVVVIIPEMCHRSHDCRYFDVPCEHFIEHIYEMLCACKNTSSSVLCCNHIFLLYIMLTL